MNDFRSAHLQGNLLARLGLWVSEYRVESGLNCGGHAFAGKGQLLGPVLAEFRRERLRLTEELGEIRERALAKLGRAPADAATCRITVQGGIGTADEDAMLRSHYAVDGTGWASPFLLCPEVVSIDDEHLKKVSEAREEDVVLSDNSPLGVPFWNLRTSASEVTRRARIDEGNPGSPCPKGYLVSNTEFTKTPICTASRVYQRRKLGEIAASAQPDAEKAAQWESVVTKSCICHDLARRRHGHHRHRSPRPRRRLLRSEYGLLQPRGEPARHGRPHLRPGRAAAGPRPPAHVPQGAVAARGAGARRRR